MEQYQEHNMDVGVYLDMRFVYLKAGANLDNLDCPDIITANGSGLCVVALSKNLKLTTTLDRAITQNPCYVPFLYHKL